MLNQLLKHWPKIIRFLGSCPCTPCPTLPEKVVIYRKTEGVSLEQMAKRIGIDPGTLGRFEFGQEVVYSSKTAILSLCDSVFDMHLE